jgi:hypothetical protein
MRVAHYGNNQTEQGKLFSAVLEDMQGRSFQVLTEVSVFHTVQRGRNTIRTVAVKEDGLHFAIKKLSKGETTSVSVSTRTSCSWA